MCCVFVCFSQWAVFTFRPDPTLSSAQCAVFLFDFCTGQLIGSAPNPQSARAMCCGIHRVSQGAVFTLCPDPTLSSAKVLWCCRYVFRTGLLIGSAPTPPSLWYCLIFAGGCFQVSRRPHPQLSAMCCGDTLFIAGGCFYAMFFRRRLFSSFAPTRPLAQRNVLCFCFLFARGN